MNQAENQRLTWAELPTAVQQWVEEIKDSAVLTAESQASGFSLGTADRLVFANSTRAFLKAVNEEEQPQTARLHRAEIQATRLLAETAPTASLIAFYDNKGWVALLLEDVEGRHPQTPWTEEDIAQTLIALDSLAGLELEGLDILDELTESISGEFRSWERIADQPLNPELYIHLASDSNLAELETYFSLLNEKAEDYAQRIKQNILPTLTGDSIVHTDLRADNILLENETGKAKIIDWPWACRGAAYFDSASILVDIVAQGGEINWADIAKKSKVLCLIPREQLETFILAYCGYYICSAQIPSAGDTNSTLPAFRLDRAVKMSRWIIAQKL